MFRIPEGDDDLHQQLQEVEANYVIQKNDLLQLDVFTNKGEKIVDPSLGSTQTPGSAAQHTTRSYLVDAKGEIKFPLIDYVKIEGLTLRDAEVIVEKEYARYYEEPFVSLNFLNKRVIVLGALGGQVIPLASENMRLTEILALAEGPGNDSKANNIRILRGQQVFVADLSTITGYQQNNIVMQPNDIVYIEPVRRPFIEAFRDYGPIISIVTSLTTIGVIIWQANNANAN